MNLELDIIKIHDVTFSDKTTASNGMLTINREELQELLEKDTRFSGVDIELAHPGESCRIVKVFDVTEPRAKMAGSGENFPGALGGIEKAGEGRTRVLRGAAVVTLDHTAGEKGGMIIEMSGPGAEWGLYGHLQNIVLLCHPADGVARSEYQHAVRVAGLRAAVYLAGATEDIKGDETEVYNLGPLSDVGKGLEHLPRVAYVFQIHSLQQSVEKPQNEPIFYGDNVRQLLPTIVHPNEVLDGAILRGNYCQGVDTYTIQNHPMIKELYERHGKELSFVGVVITVAQYTQQARERSAVVASNLVKFVLGADGAILTKIGGGAPHIDLAQTLDLCEAHGVKSVVVVGDHSTDGSTEGALLFNTPHADAIVNVGRFDEKFRLPAVEKVIGGPMIFRGVPTDDGEIEIISFGLCGGSSQLGASKHIMYEI